MVVSEIMDTNMTFVRPHLKAENTDPHTNYVVKYATARGHLTLPSSLSFCNSLTSGFRKTGLANGVSPFFFFFFLKTKRKKNGKKTQENARKRKKTEENGKKRKKGRKRKKKKKRKRHRSGDPFCEISMTLTFPTPPRRWTGRTLHPHCLCCQQA